VPPRGALRGKLFSSVTQVHNQPDSPHKSPFWQSKRTARPRTPLPQLFLLHANHVPLLHSLSHATSSASRAMEPEGQPPEEVKAMSEEQKQVLHTKRPYFLPPTNTADCILRNTREVFHTHGFS